MTILLPGITTAACIISLFLLVKDQQRQSSVLETEGDLEPCPPSGMSRSAWIYSAVCILFTVCLSVFFSRAYPENSIWGQLKRMLLLSVMWPIAYTDFKTMRIPNLFVGYGLVCRAVLLAFEVFLGHPYVWPYFLSELIAAGALLLAAVLCSLIVKGGIGFGDMKLFVVMGLMLGLEGIWNTILLSLLISFVIAVILLISKKKTRKDEIPFGPALVLGSYLSICLFGM